MTDPTNWYLLTHPLPGTGRRTRRRRVADRLLGPTRSAELARQLTIRRAALTMSLSADGRHSSQLLDDMRGRHRGERCVVLGNGPSLNETPLELLAGEITFGLNRLYLMFDRLGFGTSYHVVVNRHVVQQCARELLQVPGQLVSTWPNRPELGRRGDAVFLPKLVGPVFSRDPRRGVWEGATVTYVALQMAYWMGFDRVALVGVDHRFATTGPAHALVTSQAEDVNHFDPTYFGPGFRWQLPDLTTSEIAYGLAREAYEVDGRRIVDCTVGGALDVFPKSDLATFLA